MTRITIAVPAGLNSDDTAFASSPAWVDGSNVRFRDGKAEAKGGFESVTQTLLNGVCRWVQPWGDTTGTLNLGFGTHTHLQLFQGGMVYDITPSSSFTPGAVDGAGSSGFGTGAYGIGGYGEPSATDYFPLTWSGGAFGQTLIASPRNQTIFQWSNNTAVPAAAVMNAPAQVTFALVTPQFQVMALGCSQEVGGAFNPLCIRHSDVRDPTGWSTIASSASTSREYVLPSGGRIVGGRVIGANLLIWTADALWLGTYVGQVTQIWRFDKVGDKCGLAGPAAAVVVGSNAFWVSPDRQFHTYSLNGAVQSVDCPIRQDFADNLAPSQNDKIIASSAASYNEVRFDYPDARDGFENSRYIALCIAGPDTGAWHRGIQPRTAMVDAGPSLYPCGTTFAGNIYWHEKGRSADGAPLVGFVESADIYLDPNFVMLVRSAWPDVADQVGPLSLTITGRFFPQGDPDVYGPIALAPGQDQVDFKAKARLFKMRLDFNASPSGFRFGLITFDAKRCGRK